MDLERYISERSSVNGEIVNVDTFINHRVDARVMAQIARRMAGIAEPLRPEVIVTAEASGIPPALLTAAELGTTDGLRQEVCPFPDRGRR